MLSNNPTIPENNDNNTASEINSALILFEVAPTASFIPISFFLSLTLDSITDIIPEPPTTTDTPATADSIPVIQFTTDSI